MTLGHAAGLADGRVAGRGAGEELLDVGARVRVDDVGAGRGRARVDGVEVGDEELGVVRLGRATGQVTAAALARGAGRGDGDGCAIHVELTLAGELGDPRPGKAVLAGFEVLGYGPVVRADVCAVGAGAAALDGQDDAPVGALARLHVVGDGELAAAAAVDGGALEGEALDAACGVGIVDARLRVEGGRVAGYLAGVVGARERGVVDGLVAIRHWVCHDHVGASLGGKERDEEDHHWDDLTARYVHLD